MQGWAVEFKRAVYKEIFRDCVDYPIYKVSNFGNVFNKKTGLLLKKYVTKYGYETVTLRTNSPQKTVFVHRLVAKAFVHNNQKKPFVNHKDLVKTNNDMRNLEWVTSSENAIHAVSNGAIKHQTGKNHWAKRMPERIKYKLNENQVRYIRKSLESGRAIAKKLGVSKTTIYNIRNNKIRNNI